MTHVIGYVFNADTYHGECLKDAWIAAGTLSPAAAEMTPEEALDQQAGAWAVDRTDEDTFDSDDFPKVIMRFDEGPHTCGSCNQRIE